MKKDISDIEFEEAFGDKNNVKIIKKVTLRYSKIIQEDDLISCGIHALWRALRSHDAKYGQKFTTSLYRFCEWECKRELRKKNKKNKYKYCIVDFQRACHSETISDKAIIDMSGISVFAREGERDFEELLEMLDLGEKSIIEKRFKEEKNITEISKETNISKLKIKKTIDSAMNKIRGYYLAQGGYNT